MRRSPLVASVAIATIALGIGAITAIFSVAEAVSLRPLPYRVADRLVVATAETRQRNAVDLPFSSSIFGLIARDALVLSAAGIAIGLGAALIWPRR